MLLVILSLFFLILIIYQLIINNTNILEGMDNNSGVYKDYDLNNPNNTLILAQQNAGNIDYLKQRLDELNGLKQDVIDCCGNIVKLADQVTAISQQVSQAQTQMVGDKPPEITGTTSDNLS
jgi:hypothetical protein